MFQYVAVCCRGQRAIQLYIIVERLILGDCNDLVVRAFNWCIVCYICLDSLLIYV